MLVQRRSRRRAAALRNRRAAPACPHYPGCFGCNFIDLPYPEQLAAKHRRVSEALAAYPAIAGLKLPPVVPSPRRLRYRARVKLVVRQAGKTVLAGLYVPESHRVFDISSCPVHPEAVNRVVSYLKKKLPALGVSPYDPVTDRGQLRYLDFIYSFWRREILLTLVTRQRSFAEGRTLARLLMKRFPFIAGVLQNTNEEAGNVIWGKDFCVLAGRDSIMERIGFLKLKYPAGTFAQVNPAVAAKIYAAISELARLEKRETVLDLYCGVGPIALHLARGAALVWGVDESSLAIAAAKQNARLNGIGNCRFFADDARAKLSEAALALPAIDLVIVNPPRKGLRADIIAPLVALKAPRLIYVSCNPQTLARDLNRLSEHGYGVRFIQPFDMFPQTPEVENVALLSKAPARG